MTSATKSLEHGRARPTVRKASGVRKFVQYVRQLYEQYNKL